MAITCSIDATGITAPALADVRAYLEGAYKGIYGSDVILTEDTQDGQWIGIFAAAIHDANSMAVAVYNAFSPATAQGGGLSRVVKINGITRNVPTNSTVDLLIGGTAGTTITGGYALDAANAKWVLPSMVTIPSAGQITVTATAAVAGAVAALAGAVHKIGTPTRGWQTVTNPLAAVIGAPVEMDARLRLRQSTSTELPSSSILRGIAGAIADLSGVTSVKGYENDTSGVDTNGIPSHTISMVVEGGDAAEIADIIRRKKGPGTGTFGSTSETFVDASSGLPVTISFQRPAEVTIDVVVNLSAFAAYTTAIEEQIQQSIADYINGLDDGADVYLTRLYTPANLSGGANSSTYDITSILICRHGGTPTAANVAMGFAERAVSAVANVTVNPS